MQYQKSEVRQRIIQAGRREFLNSGYLGGKISTIAADAGVPVGNLYRYFAGKDGLFDAVVKEAYLLVPKQIAGLAENFISGFKQPTRQQDIFDKTNDNADDAIAEELTNAITKLLDEYGTEIIILMDKSENSKYADFGKNVHLIVDKAFGKIFLPESNQDKIFCFALSKAFCGVLLEFLKSSDGELRKNLIKKLISFFSVPKWGLKSLDF